MSTAPRILTIELSTYWHIGTGGGEGAQLDAVMHRDKDGLPELPGKALKGLLRDAVRHWEQVGGYPTAIEVATTLFGEEGNDGGGLLRVDTARLDDADRLALKNDPSLRQMLFHQLASTEMDGATGTAESASLRTMEVAVPLTLRASIEPLREGPTDLDWAAQLQEALPCLRSLGKVRNRGLGRIGNLELNESKA